MTHSAPVRLARKSLRIAGILACLAFVCVLFAAIAQAGPPDGKGGGGKGGGGGGGGKGGGGSASAPQPELHLQWRVPLSAAYSLVRPAVAADGTVYAVDVGDTLTAVAPDGTVLWTAANAGSKGVDVGPDGTVYTGNQLWIKAYNPDGSLKWTFDQNPTAFTTIDVAVGPDGNVYAVSSDGLGVFSLADTPAGPVLRWATPEPYARTHVGYTELAFGPTSDGSDDQLYFFANSHTRAIRLSDGAEVFTTIVTLNQRPQVSPFDGSWHVGHAAFTPDADPLWTFTYPFNAYSSEPALGPDGTHYASTQSRYLYAIDPFGVELWNADMVEWVGFADASPVDPMVVMNTLGTSTSPVALKAVSSFDGSQYWRMEFPADATGLNQFVDSGLAFSPDGRTGYVMTGVASANTTYLNAVDLDPALPSASTLLRSADVRIDVRSKRGVITFTGVVTVLDENRGPISGATVAATWTLPDGSTLAETATSGGSGEAKFPLTGEGGNYRIDVTDISLEGFAFDPAHSLLYAARGWY